MFHIQVYKSHHTGKFTRSVTSCGPNNVKQLKIKVLKFGQVAGN